MTQLLSHVDWDETGTLEGIRSFSMTDAAKGETFTFERGDEVVVEHDASSSVVTGTIGEFFGVGRVRGVHVNTHAFGQVSFYFGQPDDEHRGYRIEPT